MSEEDSKEIEESPEENTENEVDRRSIYVGNVHFSTSTEELRALFKECGSIERATIPNDHYGQPKGYAYIEFADISAVLKAEGLNEKEFKGRKLKVQPKLSMEKPPPSRGRRPFGRGRYYYHAPRRSRYHRYRHY